MGERESIKLAVEVRGAPATVSSLTKDLNNLGVKPGSTVLVHSSMRRMGWVCGATQAILEALRDVLTLDGTLVMPSFSKAVGDPSTWNDPALPEPWWQTVRENLPQYDPALTPSRGMGAIAEAFRQLPGAVRSQHPATSFVAYGAQAEDITANHSLEFGLGEGSPLARIYDADGHVLLLGVGHMSNASIALAENRTEWGSKRTYQSAAPMQVSHERRWVTYEELEFDQSDYAKIGNAFGEVGEVKAGLVGCASAMLIPQRALVDFAAEWIEKNRR